MSEQPWIDAGPSELDEEDPSQRDDSPAEPEVRFAPRPLELLDDEDAPELEDGERPATDPHGSVEPPVAQGTKCIESPAPLPLAVNGRALTWQRLSDVPMRSIVFLDKPLWQAAAFHLVVGRKGHGKGTTLAELTARATRGELGPKRNVLWIGSEDSAAIDIHPRVVAVDELGETIAGIGEVGLVIIDPLGNHITGKNANGDTDIRDAIAPLNYLADRHDCILVGIRHLTQKETTAGALAAILGASAWVQVPRAVIAIARDDDDPSVCHVQCVAGNRLPPETPGRSYQIEGVRVVGLENEVTKAVLLGESPKDVEALIAAKDETRPRIPAAKVQAVILEALAEGERPRAYLDKVALERLEANRDTVYKSGLAPLKATGRIAVRKDGLDGGWYWRRVNLDDLG
jgi:hypothetical protein